MGGRVAQLMMLTVLVFGGATGQQQTVLFIATSIQPPQSAAVNTVVNTQPATFLPQSTLPNTAVFKTDLNTGVIVTQSLTSALPNTGPLPTYINSQQASSTFPATNQLTSTSTPQQQPTSTTTSTTTTPTTRISAALTTTLSPTALTSPVKPLTGGINTVVMTAIPSSAGPASTPIIASTAKPHPPIRVQVVFANSFNVTAGLPNGVNASVYVASLVPGIANACHVTDNRITDVSVMSQPDTGFLVARFTVQPPQSVNCIGASCDVSLKDAFDSFYSLANSRTLIIQDYYFNNLTVAFANFNLQIVTWRDNGPCPVSVCQLDKEICDCSLAGTLYCRTVTSASSTSSSPNLLYLLLLLLIIPIVVVIVVLVIVFRRRRQQKQQQHPLKKVNLRADMLTYKEYVTKQENQPKVATISSRYHDDNLGTMFRSLGEHVSIAFNSTTFVDPNDDRSSGASILTNDTTVAE